MGGVEGEVNAWELRLVLLGGGFGVKIGCFRQHKVTAS